MRLGVEEVEALYARGKERARYLSEPLFAEREQYLTLLREQGLNKRSVQGVATQLLHLISLLNLTEMRDVKTEEIEAASRLWSADPSMRFIRQKPGKRTGRLLADTAKKWLRFHRRLVEPEPIDPIKLKISDFSNALATRGQLAVRTIETYTWYASKFLVWFREHHGDDLSSVSLNEVDDYTRCQRNRGLGPSTLTHVLISLRTFFRHAELRGWCKPPIADNILIPIQSHNPQRLNAPAWKEVRRFLSSTDHDDDPRLIRAHAVSLLFSIYGLRASEVGRLFLTDFDWNNEILTIKRSKNGRIQQFPIQCEVGEAIIKYLQKSRPRCSCRNLFVTLRPPHRPIQPSEIWRIVGPPMREMKIAADHHGPHMLRHACATQLLKKGFSLQEIADFLGHRDINSVSTYGKVRHSFLPKDC